MSADTIKQDEGIQYGTEIQEDKKTLENALTQLQKSQKDQQEFIDNYVGLDTNEAINAVLEGEDNPSAITDKFDQSHIPQDVINQYNQEISENSDEHIEPNPFANWMQEAIDKSPTFFGNQGEQEDTYGIEQMQKASS